MYLITYELLEDLAKPGCPVCRGAHRAGWDWIHGLLHDDANDPHVRQTLERNGGLCPEHTRLVVAVAAEEGDSLGLSIVMEFLLAAAGRRLDDGERRAPVQRTRRWRRARTPLVATTCGACEAEARRVTAYVEILTQSSSDYLRRASEEPERALCLVHLSGVIAAGEPEVRRLLRVARRRAETLRAHIAAIVPAHASTTGLPTLDDPVLWREAPDWLAAAARRPPPRRDPKALRR